MVELFNQNLSYGLIMAFFPNYALKKKISFTEIGIIIANYPIGQISATFFLEKYLLRFKNKKKISIIYNFGLFISQISFGCSNFIKNKYLFIIVTSIIRLVQGFSTGTATSFAMSSINELYPHEDTEFITKKKVSLRFGITIGIFLGPIIGSLIYNNFGYEKTFFIFSTFPIVSGIFMFTFFPNLYNDEELNNENQISESLIKEEINYFKIFTNKEILLNLIFFSIQSINVLSISVGFTTNIIKTFKYSLLTASALYSLYGLFGIIAISILITIKLKKYYLITNIAFLSLMTSMFLIGPCNLIGIPNYISIVIIAEFFAFGICISVLFLSLTIFYEILERNNLIINKKRISNLSSNLYIIFYATGELFGPIFGGILNEKVGYKNGEALLGFCGFLYYIFYMIFIGFYNLKREYYSELNNKIY